MYLNLPESFITIAIIFMVIMSFAGVIYCIDTVKRSIGEMVTSLMEDIISKCSKDN